MHSDPSEALHASLRSVQDPEILRPITELGMVREARVNESGEAFISLALTIAGCPAAQLIEERTTSAALRTPGVVSATVEVGVMSATERAEFTKVVRGSKNVNVTQFGPQSLTRVIAITSGKGGVGKSSITANLATYFAQKDLRVGLIDADVFGFSIPALMGLVNDGIVTQPSRVDELILPPVAHGVKVISIGMFLGGADQRDTAVSWRGPMLHRTLEQFLTDVWFGDLDILLIDMPPGTGDVAISMAQLLPQAEIVVVTTPQEAAADVAVRSALLARQAGQTLLGVIENMSGLTLPDGTTIDLFGSGGAENVAQRLSNADGVVEVLGKIPLSEQFRMMSDSGVPAVSLETPDVAASAIIRVAERIQAKALPLQGKKLPIQPKT